MSYKETLSFTIFLITKFLINSLLMLVGHALFCAPCESLLHVIEKRCLCCCDPVACLWLLIIFFVTLLLSNLFSAIFGVRLLYIFPDIYLIVNIDEMISQSMFKVISINLKKSRLGLLEIWARIW